MATRWRSPPESSDGLWLRRWESPTRPSILLAFSVALATDSPAISSGMAAFSSALNSESRWWNW